MSEETNPFASPQAVSEFAGVDVAPHEGWRVIPYASGHTRAVWAMSLIGLVMLVDIISVGSTLSQIQLIEGIRAGRRPTPAEIQLNDSRQRLIALGHTAIFLASAVAFLMWIHRAHRNLPALDARRLQYSPGWAVGYFFIPIVNLFRPYQVMKEIWQGSDPAVSPQGQASLRKRGAALVGWWWTFWLIMNIFAQIEMRMSLDTSSLDALIAGSWTGVISDLLTVPAAIVTILMIRAVDADQDERIRALHPAAALAGQGPGIQFAG